MNKPRLKISICKHDYYRASTYMNKNYTNKGLKNKSTIIVVDYTSQSNHTRTTAVSNSMKLSHARGATQDRWVMVERSDRMWS